MTDTALIPAFCRLFDEARIDVPYRVEVARVVLQHFLSIAQYREKRKSLREKIGEDSEQAVYDFVRPRRTSYFTNVILWRAIYCAVDTQDTQKAATLFNVPVSDISWVLAMFRDTDTLTALPESAPAHWSVAPLSEHDVHDIVQHKCVQGTIKRSLRYEKSGIIWHHDRAVDEEDLVSELTCHACATVLRYEACRRSRWHLINSVNMAINNYVNNMLRISTSLESGHVVDADRLAGAKKGERSSNASSVQRIVPLVTANDDGEDIEHQAAITDRSFADSREVSYVVANLSKVLPENLVDYLRVTVLGEHHDDFEKWSITQDTTLTETRRRNPDLLFKQAEKYFRVSRDDKKRMQGALSA